MTARLTIVCVFFVLAFLRPIQAAEEVIVFTQEDGNAVDFYVQNKLYCEASLRLTLTLTNMTSTFPVTSTRAYPARATTKVGRISPTNPTIAWSYNYNFTWAIGDYAAQHNDLVNYRLPWVLGKRHQVIQGYNGTFSHAGKYALDFDFALGTEIRSARSGKVVRVVESYSKGGTDPSFLPKGNEVLVRNADATICQYLHLKKDGASVTVGNKVTEGQLIGYSGNTGYSSGPHLHFQVFKAAKTIGDPVTIPTKFKTGQGIGIQLVEGRTYSAVK